MAQRAMTKAMAPDPGHEGRIVTSYDVARQAGVSQSAVSRCFTQGASVSPRTRERIMKAADDLGYQPNMIARSLITKRSNLIAIIVANLGYNPEFTATLSRAFAARGLNLLFYTLDAEEEADRVIDQLWQYRVDGVVSATHLSVRHVERLAKRKVPLIFLNRASGDIAINSVSCDQEEGERWLVDRLWAGGHRRFAIVTGPDTSSVSRQRVLGARERLAQLGATSIELLAGDFTYAGGRAAIADLVTLPDAVICANDMMAIGCIDELRHARGCKVPEDVSVVGFDGSAPGGWLAYDLTTVRQPTSIMVEAAIDMLVARIERPDLHSEKRVFSGELVIGRSARLG